MNDILFWTLLHTTWSNSRPQLKNKLATVASWMWPVGRIFPRSGIDCTCDKYTYQHKKTIREDFTVRAWLAGSEAPLKVLANLVNIMFIVPILCLLAQFFFFCEILYHSGLSFIPPLSPDFIPFNTSLFPLLESSCLFHIFGNFYTSKTWRQSRNKWWRDSTDKIPG